MAPGDTFWIRADTLENRKHGYQNGIRAILHIAGNNIVDNDNVMDPGEDIVKAQQPAEERRTMNCYSNLEREVTTQTGKGSCLSITTLRSQNTAQNHINKTSLDKKNNASNTVPFAVRTVDFDFNPAPLHAIFTRIQHGKWFQNVIGTKTPYFNADHDLHPHAIIMNVPAYSDVIIIWRNRSLMDQ